MNLVLSLVFVASSYEDRVALCLMATERRGRDSLAHHVSLFSSVYNSISNPTHVSLSSSVYNSIIDPTYFVLKRHALSRNHLSTPFEALEAHSV